MKAQSSPLPVSLPLELRQGSLLVKVPVNGSAPLTFKLDTGFGVTVIRPELVEPLKLQRVGKLTIVGIAGEEDTATYSGAVFDFAGASYAPRRVAAMPGRRGRDGILGAGFFKRFVVELDPAAKQIRLHDPAQFSYTGKGEVIALGFPKDTPVISAVLARPSGAAVEARFEIDLGCTGCLCLGHDFVEANELDAAEKSSKAGTRSGVGGSKKIRTGELSQLQLGGVSVEKPAVNFFLEGSPVDKGLAGHIGAGVLQQFRVFFDYSRKRMILERLR